MYICVCEVVLINILVLQLGPQTKIPDSAPYLKGTPTHNGWVAHTSQQNLMRSNVTIEFDEIKKCQFGKTIETSKQLVTLQVQKI